MVAYRHEEFVCGVSSHEGDKHMLKNRHKTLEHYGNYVHRMCFTTDAKKKTKHKAQKETEAFHSHVHLM